MILQVDRNFNRIEICGGIASGKTTFASLFGSTNLDIFLENFQENPFWKSFYEDPVAFSFETEITFLLQHYHQIKVGSKKGEAFICDFSLFLDLAYADVTLSCRKYDIFQEVYQEILRDLCFPDLLVFLECNAEIQLERIISRGRKPEVSITLEYLNAVNEALVKRVAEFSKKSQILIIDSGQQDFVSDEIIQKELVKFVLDQT
jgi:deoxyguanosine kinase